MTLDQLRIFVAVAEREHLTHASRTLGLTQSAVSSAISTLEARHQVRLFDRVGRGLKLTVEGRIFLNEARAVLDRTISAEAVLHDIAGLRRGAITVAASQTVANHWLPGRLGRFNQLHPHISISVMIGNSVFATAQVENGTADLGVIEGQIVSGKLNISAVAEDEMLLVVAPRHPWVLAGEITPHHFPATKWVLREKGSGTRAVFETVLQQAELSIENIEIALELPSNEAVQAATEAGINATIMSGAVVSRAIEAGALARVNCWLPKRQYFLLQPKGRHVTRAAEMLSKLLSENTAAG